MTKKKVDDLFFRLFCEKNSDGTRHLRLRGKELNQRIGRRLQEHDMHLLAVFLKKNPDVTSVDLSYNNLKDDGAKMLADYLFNDENYVENLNLAHCDLLAPGLKFLSSAKELRLKKIWLVGNKIGPEGARYLGRLVENCPTLEVLDIGETDQTLESTEALLIVIEKSHLKNLNISRIIPHSYYSGVNDATLAENLKGLLKLNNSLEVLRVQKCGIDGHSVEILLGGLAVHRNLTMLDLGANHIADHGVQLLSNWLKSRPNLIILMLSANNIGTPGAQALALCLPFSRIRLLDLQNNKIGDQGLSDIFDTIKKYTQLRLLYIWGNELGDMSLAKLEWMLSVGNLEKDCIDVQIYYVDGKRQAAYYPSNHFRHRSYFVQDYGFLPELKIIRNEVPSSDTRPRALIDAEFIDRFPPVDKRLAKSVVKKPPRGSWLPNMDC